LRLHRHVHLPLILLWVNTLCRSWGIVLLHRESLLSERPDLPVVEIEMDAVCPAISWASCVLGGNVPRRGSIPSAYWLQGRRRIAAAEWLIQRRRGVAVVEWLNERGLVAIAQRLLKGGTMAVAQWLCNGDLLREVGLRLGSHRYQLPLWVMRNEVRG
jgi:hypothetical protein